MYRGGGVIGWCEIDGSREVYGGGIGRWVSAICLFSGFISRELVFPSEPVIFEGENMISRFPRNRFPLIIWNWNLQIVIPEPFDYNLYSLVFKLSFLVPFGKRFTNRPELFVGAVSLTLLLSVVLSPLFSGASVAVFLHPYFFWILSLTVGY